MSGCVFQKADSLFPANATIHQQGCELLPPALARLAIFVCRRE